MITEFLMVSGGKENALKCLISNIDLKSISKLLKAMDIEGMENIDKVEKK